MVPAEIGQFKSLACFMKNSVRVVSNVFCTSIHERVTFDKTNELYVEYQK